MFEVEGGFSRIVIEGDSVPCNSRILKSLNFPLY